MGYTRSTDRLIAELSRLPGVGRRAAQTMVLDILKLPQEEAVRLARLILEVKKKTRACTACFNLTEEELCPICSDQSRDRGLLCVVEEPQSSPRSRDWSEQIGQSSSSVRLKHDTQARVFFLTSRIRRASRTASS